MQLSKGQLKKITQQPDLVIPDEKIFDLPEKVLQFGTGVLLRGLPDYFIDKANRQGLFNGRIVVVKSTSGSTDAFAQQDGLYTLCVRGIDADKKIEETIINSSISRVLSATEQWSQVLHCARDSQIRIIISNTTEVGIVFTEDDIFSTPPSSFPGKLLAVLYERYSVFNGAKDKGFVVVPTELITNNGEQLFSIIRELAIFNKLEQAFLDWLQEANHFCNSLVDRIVPGRFPAVEQQQMEEKLGYKDDLMIMAESFRLWAIESGDPAVADILSFSKADEGVIITPDIRKFRELKLRLLNGTHTFCCSIAILSGFKTVKEAMHHQSFVAYMRRLVMLEIAIAMESPLISYNEACAFANKVMDRFQNPFMEHRWLSISMNATSKMRLRNIPLLQQFYRKTGKSPEHMAIGFAAYLLWMKGEQEKDGLFYKHLGQDSLLIQDEAAAHVAGKWKVGNTEEAVNAILADKELWGEDLTALDGFANAVNSYVQRFQNENTMTVIENNSIRKTAV